VSDELEGGDDERGSVPEPDAGDVARDDVSLDLDLDWMACAELGSRGFADGGMFREEREGARAAGCDADADAADTCEARVALRCSIARVITPLSIAPATSLPVRPGAEAAAAFASIA
jgi:hypothetical protein